MKGIIISSQELETIKERLAWLKKEKKRLFGKINRGTDDCWDNTDLDRVLGEIDGINFVLKTVGVGK